mmetsp:Transcript_8624/g.19678  ORF Transcript_8624/g.19678 Transcript_8624/m.19678 type:complete len:275 (+) Transcript_8624:488-1312(+)
MLLGEVSGRNVAGPGQETVHADHEAEGACRGQLCPLSEEEETPTAAIPPRLRVCKKLDDVRDDHARRREVEEAHCTERLELGQGLPENGLHGHPARALLARRRGADSIPNTRCHEQGQDEKLQDADGSCTRQIDVPGEPQEPPQHPEDEVHEAPRQQEAVRDLFRRDDDEEVVDHYDGEVGEDTQHDHEGGEPTRGLPEATHLGEPSVPRKQYLVEKVWALLVVKLAPDIALDGQGLAAITESFHVEFTFYPHGHGLPSGQAVRGRRVQGLDVV